MDETVKSTRSGVSLRNLVGYGLGEVGCQLSWYMTMPPRSSALTALCTW